MLLAAVLLAARLGVSAQAVPSGVAVTGVVHDQTGAVLAGAGV
jgi:hypothetical protein